MLGIVVNAFLILSLPDRVLSYCYSLRTCWRGAAAPGHSAQNLLQRKHWPHPPQVMSCLLFDGGCLGFVAAYGTGDIAPGMRGHNLSQDTLDWGKGL